MVLIARWPQSSSFSLLASSISKQNGTAIGRFIVQIRSFRHPEVSAATASTVAAAATLGGGAGSSTGKNMYVVRYQDKSEGYVFIEHLNASSGTEEKGAQMAIDKAEITTTATTPGHSKWTYAVLGPAPSSSDALPNAPTSFPFDHLLQRVLCVAQPTVSAWIQRPSQILIDGYTFNSGDWLIRVGVIQVKGSSVAAKGLVVEVTYLPVPSLPSSSPFIRDYILSLFPPSAAKEVQLIAIDDDAFEQVGLARCQSRSIGAGGDDDDKVEEWTDAHSSYSLLKICKQEGLF